MHAEPDRWAFLIHDMVNERVKPGGRHPDAGDPGMSEVIAKQRRLLEAMRARAVPVFYSHQALREDYGNAAFGARSPSRGANLSGSWGAQIIDELKPRAADWIIQKGGGYSVFTGTPFEKFLRRLAVETLVLVGAGTHAGIESTARDAQERDLGCIVVGDACCGQSRFHELALTVMDGLNGVSVMRTEDVVRHLEEGSADGTQE